MGLTPRPTQLQESANILLTLTSHSKLENSSCSSTGMPLLVCFVQQFWRDRGEESLEEFSHLCPLQRRAVNLFIQLLNCWPEFCKLGLKIAWGPFHDTLL